MAIASASSATTTVSVSFSFVGHYTSESENSLDLEKPEAGVITDERRHFRDAIMIHSRDVYLIAG